MVALSGSLNCPVVKGICTVAPSFFARRLAELRTAADMSQYALGKRTGLTRQAISNLEAGINEPNWVTVQLIAAALKVSCEAFEDPDVKLTEWQPKRPGRPRKEPPPEVAPKKPSRKKRT